jgi:hypothetical protein
MYLEKDGEVSDMRECSIDMCNPVRPRPEVGRFGGVERRVDGSFQIHGSRLMVFSTYSRVYTKHVRDGRVDEAKRHGLDELDVAFNAPRGEDLVAIPIEVDLVSEVAIYAIAQFSRKTEQVRCRVGHTRQMRE